MYTGYTNFVTDQTQFDIYICLHTNWYRQNIHVLSFSLKRHFRLAVLSLILSYIFYKRTFVAGVLFAKRVTAQLAERRPLAVLFHVMPLADVPHVRTSQHRYHREPLYRSTGIRTSIIRDFNPESKLDII